MKNEPSNNETSADLEFEARLSKALARLPDALVASNFTARVMQAVELEESRLSRKWNFRWNWHVLLPRVAVAMALMVFTGLTIRHFEQNTHRAALARSVAFVAGNQSLPSVETLKNFDVIERMSQTQHADEELLALLQ